MRIAASDHMPSAFMRAALLLLLQQQPDHGYDLHARLAEFGVDSDTGVVYRALRSLEHEGHVVSAWQASTSGPARRCYELTLDGADHLDQLVAEMHRTAERLAHFLTRATQTTGAVQLR